MAVRLSGDFDRLERLIDRSARISSASFRRELLEHMASEVSRQIALGFRLAQDPYGKPWEPLKLRAGRPLYLSGALQRAAANAKPAGLAIMVQVDLVQAAVQHYGARIRARNAKALRFRAGGKFIFAKSVTIPARPYLPEGDLPKRWRDGLANVVALELSRTLRG